MLLVKLDIHLQKDETTFTHFNVSKKLVMDQRP